MNELPVPRPLRFSSIFVKTSGIATGQTDQSITVLELKYAIGTYNNRVFVGFKLELKLGD